MILFELNGHYLFSWTLEKSDIKKLLEEYYFAGLDDRLWENDVSWEGEYYDWQSFMEWFREQPVKGDLQEVPIDMYEFVQITAEKMREWSLLRPGHHYDKGAVACAGTSCNDENFFHTGILGEKCMRCKTLMVDLDKIKVEVKVETEEEKIDVIAEIDKLVLEAEEDPNIPEEEKEIIKEFASKVSESLTEFEKLSENMEEK